MKRLLIENDAGTRILLVKKDNRWYLQVESDRVLASYLPNDVIFLFCGQKIRAKDIILSWLTLDGRTDIEKVSAHEFLFQGSNN